MFLASNGGTLIQRSRFFLQYLGRKTSFSFSVSYIKAPEQHFLLLSSQFVIFRASKHPNSSPIRSLIIFSKRDFNNPQKLRRSVRALVYVSFTFTTSLISSNNLFGSSFSHPQTKNGQIRTLSEDSSFDRIVQRKVPHTPGSIDTILFHREIGI